MSLPKPKGRKVLGRKVLPRTNLASYCRKSRTPPHASIYNAITYVSFICISSLLLFACPGPSSSGSGSSGSSAIKSMNLKDAVSLTVVPKSTLSTNIDAMQSGPARSTAASEKVFAKILADGSIQEVEILDGNGGRVPLVPTKILPASNDYLILTVAGRYFYTDSKYYLVNKSSGAVYLLSDGGKYLFDYTSDTKQNIYIVYSASGGMEVKKIDVSDPKRITVSDYIPKGAYKSIERITVDTAGNLLFQHTDYNSGSAVSGVELRKATGGHHTIQQAGTDSLQWAFTGYDGYIYYSVKSSAQKKISVAADGTVTQSEDKTFSNFYGKDDYLKYFYLENKIVLADTSSNGGKMIYAYQKSGSSTAVHTVAGLQGAKILTNNKTAIYMVT
ncbi:MAG: hypothetical protein AAF975_06970, partial [Spirochaetota bacterium]